MNTLKFKQVSFNNTVGNKRSTKLRRTTLKCIPEKPCNEKQILRDCKSSNSSLCSKHFPCTHKKGYTEFKNINNLEHYLKTQDLRNKKKSRNDYGFLPAPDLFFKRSKRGELALWTINDSQKKGKFLLLNNGNILEIYKNKKGLLSIIKK